MWWCRRKKSLLPASPDQLLASQWEDLCHGLLGTPAFGFGTSGSKDLGTGLPSDTARSSRVWVQTPAPSGGIGLKLFLEQVRQLTWPWASPLQTGSWWYSTLQCPTPSVGLTSALMSQLENRSKSASLLHRSAARAEKSITGRLQRA